MLADLAAWAEAWALWLGIGAAGVVLAYDLYFRWRLPAHRNRDAHGSAHWADRREVKRSGLMARQGLLFGRLGGRLLRVATDRHILTIAPTRSGKGVSAIIPNALTYEGSMVILDPKGETTAIAARRRRELGQDVYVLDPWNETAEPSARFNPLALLDPAAPRFVDDVRALGYALVPDAIEGAHWLDEARSFIIGLIMHVVSASDPELRTLGEVRRLLMQAPAQFQQTLANMAASTAARGKVARAANAMLQKAERERSGVLSSAQKATAFLESDELVDSLAVSDFDFGDAKGRDRDGNKRRPMTIFIVIPADLLESHAQWLRITVNQALMAMIRRKGKPKRSVLFLLDEFAALGFLRPVEAAMGLLAGYGIQLWVVLQDLAQLRAAYPASWPTFLANAGILQWFGVAETSSAQWLSERLGALTVSVRTQSLAGAALGADGPGRYSEGFGVIQRPLMTADELMRMAANDEILVRPGQSPVMAQKLNYLQDGEFQGHFDPNPYHQLAA